MHKLRNRLLITLVCTAVATAAGWSVSDAYARRGGSHSSALTYTIRKPGASPTSGEPDVGQTK